MARPRRGDFLIPTLQVLVDAAAIELAFVVSHWLRFNTSLLRFLPLTEDTPSITAYVLSSLVVIPVWLVINRRYGLYGARRNADAGDEFFTIVKAVTLGMLIVMSAAFFYRAFSYSRIVFVLLWGSAILFLALGRLALRHYERSLYRHGRSLRNAIIIGAGPAALEIAGSVRRNPLLGYQLCGYVAAERRAAGWDLPYLGPPADVPAIVGRVQAELALIALPSSSHDDLFRLVEACEGMDVEFLLVPDVVELAASTLTVKEIAGIPFIKIKGMPITTWGRIVKRTFDILVSASLLLLLSPLLLLAAAGIRLDSPGPVFFAQERLGRGGRPFRMLKFRSMKLGAERSDREAGLGIEDDPRQTRFGALLRRASIDELPQLINVLRGEMSLVGPRPERTYYVEQFRDDIPKYLDRHRMKTGMTGWAQVNGLRGNTSLEERVKFDLYYIENWSMALDLKILLRTMQAVLGSPRRISADTTDEEQTP